MRGQLHFHERCPARLCRYDRAPAGLWGGFHPALPARPASDRQLQEAGCSKSRSGHLQVTLKAAKLTYSWRFGALQCW